MQPLVSIVIPTYNRYHLIGETLDSIIKQTYSNWECIIVDDTSSDYTLQLLECYSSKDRRIKYYERPPDCPKGANSCRNYGFEQSNGEFINWFDSDDLMVENFLELKLRTILEKGVDYVITKTACFSSNDPEDIIHKNEEYYQFDKYAITNFNYVTQKINWLTYDFFGRRDLVEKVRFNEKLNAFQERNFFCKLTCFSVNTFVMDAFVTLVRIHPKSIQSGLKENNEVYYRELQEFFFQTWKDVLPIAPKNSVDYLFLRTVEYAMHFKTRRTILTAIARQYFKEGKIQSLFWFGLYQTSFLYTGRGHIFKRKLQKLR